jgi:hypothetical protein
MAKIVEHLHELCQNTNSQPLKQYRRRAVATQNGQREAKALSAHPWSQISPFDSVPDFSFISSNGAMKGVCLLEAFAAPSGLNRSSSPYARGGPMQSKSIADHVSSFHRPDRAESSDISEAR